MVPFVFVGALLLVAAWEFWRPRRQHEFPTLWRRVGNVGFWLINLAIAAVMFGSPSSTRHLLKPAIAARLPSWPFGNGAAGFMAGFVVLDLLSYWLHRWQHAARFLWRLHAVHHSDPEVDVTTSVRHHPIEYLIATAIYWLAVLVLDVPAAVAIDHALAVFVLATVTHGNVRLLRSLEWGLQPVIITPDLHLVHHSIVYNEANANFGAVLSIWDRLFGTFIAVSCRQHAPSTFGIRELPQLQCLKVSTMIIMPWLLKRIAVTAGQAPDAIDPPG